MHAYPLGDGLTQQDRLAANLALRLVELLEQGRAIGGFQRIT
jgi:hypothetical protein